MLKFKNFGVGWFSVGLILGVGFTLLFAVWFGEPFYEIEAANHNSKPKKDYNQQGFGPVPPAFIVTQDTLAQWIMALFSMVATGFSIFAVLLVRDTLQTSVESNEIMRIEQRPWLTIESEMHGHFSVEEGEAPRQKGKLLICWSMQYNAINKGKSPAMKYKFSTKVVCGDSWFGSHGNFVDFVDSSDAVYHRSGGPLFSEEKTEFGKSNQHVWIDDVEMGGRYFTVFIKLEYTDASGTLKGVDGRCYHLQQAGPSIGPHIQEFRHDPTIRITR